MKIQYFKIQQPNCLIIIICMCMTRINTIRSFIPSLADQFWWFSTNTIFLLTGHIIQYNMRCFSGVFHSQLATMCNRYLLQCPWSKARSFQLKCFYLTACICACNGKQYGDRQNCSHCPFCAPIKKKCAQAKCVEIKLRKNWAQPGDAINSTFIALKCNRFQRVACKKRLLMRQREVDSVPCPRRAMRRVGGGGSISPIS